MRFIASPALYAVWLVVVLVSLVATYFVHPYVFAFTTLGLGWVSVAIGVLGCAVCFFAKTPDRRAKLAILACCALSGVAVTAALALLSTFKWA